MENEELSLYEKFTAFVERLKAALSTHIPNGSSTLSLDDQKNVQSLLVEADDMLDEFAPFPKQLHDPNSGRPDQRVNDAEEEAAARADGFTVLVPIPEEEAPVKKSKKSK
jgi:hypothetical protein